VTAFRDPLTRSIAGFLSNIGIVVESCQLRQETFLPGILIDAGRLMVDEEKLRHPGDLLHEAGHLAVVSPQRRAQLQGNVGTGDGAEEMPAIAWSWAALTHLELDPEVVFHADGYHGASASIIENFSQGYYFGVPVLQWLGMTWDEAQAVAQGVAPYPHMIKWLCE
jgi:hypothetical protein